MKRPHMPPPPLPDNGITRLELTHSPRILDDTLTRRQIRRLIGDCTIQSTLPQALPIRIFLITNRSFTFASPYLWNQLPSSFRQPHSVHCSPGSPRPAHRPRNRSSRSIESIVWGRSRVELREGPKVESTDRVDSLTVELSWGNGSRLSRLIRCCTQWIQHWWDGRHWISSWWLQHDHGSQQ